MPGLQRPGSVKLFRQHDPGESVRQRKRRQGPGEVGSLTARVGYAVRTADDQAQVATVRLPCRETRRQCFAGQLFAAFIEQDDLLVGPELREQRLAFGVDCTHRGFVLRAPGRGNSVETKSPFAGKPACVAVKRVVHPARLPVTDGQEPDVHSLTVGRRDARRRTE